MTAKLNQSIENGKENAEKIENKSLTINDLKTNMYLNRYGNGRLDCPVCIVKGVAPKIIEKTTLRALTH